MIQGFHTEVLINLMENKETMEALQKALSTYPMYVPESETVYTIIPTREQLNKKILDHYAFREIGFETVGRFLKELETTMCEIMPYYYQLFKSADILNAINDPFGNVDIKEVFEQESTGSSNGTTTGTSNNKIDTSASSTSKTDMNNNSKNVSANTPQGENGILSKGTKDINGVTYADNVTWNEDINSSEGTTSDTGNTTGETSSSGTTKNETTGTLKHTFTKVGNQGVNTYAHDLKELRETFLNIEQQIIEDERLSELFMRVF